jgi:transposase
MTDDGQSFFARFREHATTEYAKHIIFVLYNEVRLDSIPDLDITADFRVSAPTVHQARDGLAFVRLAAYRPDLNPVEACWRQLDSALRDRCFESITDLTSRIGGTLDQLNFPVVGKYF